MAAARDARSAGPVRRGHRPAVGSVHTAINPFYPKDPHASFGKHVLKPTLALTSIAGVIPPMWRIEYWDENLLHFLPAEMRAARRRIGHQRRRDALWPRILRDVAAGTLQARYEATYRDDPPPRRALLPQPLRGFCCLSTEGLWIPYRTRQAEQIAREFAPTTNPTRCLWTTTSAPSASFCANSAAPCVH